MTVAVTALLAQHVATTRYEALSQTVLRQTRWSLLDLVGVMHAASSLGEGCAAFVDLARSSAAAPQCSILGSELRTSPLLAALVHGSFAHALDFEDAYDPALLHPNSASIPAALALLQGARPVSGRELITALALACDMTCRIGLSLRADPSEFGWYTPPIVGAFGAAAAAGRLLQLDARQINDALSFTLCQSTGSAQQKYSPQSLVRSVREAFAAQAGLMSALLAQRGLRGFDAALEGPAGLAQLYARSAMDTDAALADLGERFEGERVSFKPWPSCRATHAYIEAALQLMREHRFRADDVSEALLYGGPLQQFLFEPAEQKLRPRTAIDAKFSLPFTLASTLVHGSPTLEHFMPAALADAGVLELAQRVHFTLEGSGRQRGAGGALTLRLRDGSELSARIVKPRGDPDNALTETEMVDKFRRCCAYSARPMSAARIERLADRLLHLEELDDVGAELFST